MKTHRSPNAKPVSDFVTDLKIMAGKLNGLVKSLPGQAGALALESIDDNFRGQGFFGEPWPLRADGTGGKSSGPKRGAGGKFVKGDGGGRGLLVLSGRLRRSFTLSGSGLTIIIQTDVPYAEAHNEGGVVKQDVAITPKMRKFFWAMYRETQDEQWKGMALTKKATLQRTFTMPKRQFMGEHPELDKRISSLLEQELSTIFGQ
ncbi:hypothetical protein [Hymenobacter sp. B81]|uniref:hypothetical protein n=1 Tax=Hymenobacter sp. B81 TaxID=3344878 RepID=UPI0037DC4E69